MGRKRGLVDKLLQEHGLEALLVVVFVMPLLQGLVKIILKKMGDDSQACKTAHNELLRPICAKLDNIRGQIESMSSRYDTIIDKQQTLIGHQQEEIAVLREKVKKLEKDNDFNRTRG